MITSEQLSELFPALENPEIWATALETILPEHEITDGPRLWMFLAQCGHESNGFTTLKENLNYSASGLLRTFPKYFDNTLAANCSRSPERIANIAYANRMGNGSKLSGDGWKFKGRGLIQITGRRNYAGLSMDLWGDDRAVNDPDMLLEPENAIASACWYWDATRLNQYCDNEDVETVTKKINGGTNGLDQRQSLYDQAKQLLS